MTDHDDLDMQAAEFVLGTLDAEERDAVTRRRHHEPELDALILDWQARLAPLDDEVHAVAPDPALWGRIEQRIAVLETSPEQQTDTHHARADDSRVVSLRKRLRYWQWGTGLATAAALLLAVMLVVPVGKGVPEKPFVAVFQQNDQQPAFMLSVDLDSQRLHVQPVTAEPLPNKSYQLWIKADSLGPAPRSVGVLNDDMSLDPRALSQYVAFPSFSMV